MAMRPAAAPVELNRPDTQEGWPAPEEQTAWYGAPDIERQLAEAWRGKRMHHAWLIGGPKGIGKATLAYRFARYVLSTQEKPDNDTLALNDDDPAVGKVAARAHPNLLVIERAWDERGKRFRTELTVSEVRRTVPFFGTTAGEGAWRVAIVDAADEMNRSAANALLKILEEPPRNALFLIVTHAPGRLLPTIRSRCRRLMLPPLTDRAIATALADHGIEDAAAARASALAGGSLRRAAMFADGDAADVDRALARLLDTLPRVDIEAVYGLADMVGTRGRDERWRLFQDLVAAWLNRRVRAEPEPGAAGEAASPHAAVPLERWAEVWENLGRVVADTDVYNLDRKRSVLSIMQALARATRM